MSALLDARVAELLGAVLLQSLWQGAVIGAVAAVVLAFLRRPMDRYRVACFALVALLLWPGFTAVRLAADASSAVTVVDAAAATEGGPTAAALPPEPVAYSDASAAEAPLTGANERGGAVAEPGIAAAVPAALEGRVAPFLALLWLVGVLVGLARLALGLTLVAHLRRSGNVAGAQVVAMARGVAERLGLRLRVAILETTRVSSPMIVGILRPTLLLPAGLAPTLPPAQLEAVLAHELAHVLRRDYFVNLLQRLAETLMFHHPATWWLSDVARAERENLCDDAAVRTVGGDPRPLAEALATLAAIRGNAQLVSVGAAEGPLVARVKRLLARDDRPCHTKALSLQASRPALLLSVLALLAPFVAQPMAGAQASGTEARELELEVPLPFELRYGNYFGPGGAPFQALYMHVNLEPRRTASIVPATLRVLDSTGETLHEEEMDYPVQAGTWPVSVTRAAAVEVTTAKGTWTVPIDIRPAPEGFGAVEEVRVVEDSGAGMLVWDEVPGAASYRVIFFEYMSASVSATVLHTREPEVSLAGLAPGSYKVAVETYSRDPSTPGQVLTMDFGASFDLGPIEVPAADSDAAAGGAIEGRFLLGDQPAAGVAVELYPAPIIRGPNPARTAVTDSEGIYRFDDVTPGIYSVNPVIRPSTPPLLGVRTWVMSTPFSVAEGRTAKPADLFMQQTIAARGPLASGTATPGEVELQWHPVPQATRYFVTVSERVVRTQPWESAVLYESHAVDDVSLTLSLEPQSVYEVTIEAVDAEGVRVGQLLTELRTTPTP